MQYIGLVDVNGRGVYEGDIVVFQDGDSWQKILRIIEWQNEDFAYVAKHLEFQGKRGGGTFLAGTKSYQIKIVGNIYEDPDLLKK